MCKTSKLCAGALGSKQELGGTACFSCMWEVCTAQVVHLTFPAFFALPGSLVCHKEGIRGCHQDWRHETGVAIEKMPPKHPKCWLILWICVQTMWGSCDIKKSTKLTVIWQARTIVKPFRAMRTLHGMFWSVTWSALFCNSGSSQKVDNLVQLVDTGYKITPTHTSTESSTESPQLLKNCLLCTLLSSLM